MSQKYPIIAITGSSGAGTFKVGGIFEHIAWRQKIRPLVIQGSGFHRYNRDEMTEKVDEALARKRHFSHFCPEANNLDRLDELLRTFAESGGGRYRHYIHTLARAGQLGQEVGTFTPWEDVPEETDLLVYQGLHGAYRGEGIDITRHSDLAIGVAPIVNLEWIQKIHNDIMHRGYTLDEVKMAIQSRLHDYVHYITPQFSRTDINFQRIPLVDTSNPFISRDVPTCDESMVVVRFRKPGDYDFPHLLEMLEGAFMTRRNTIVVPGGKMDLVLELLLNPIVQEMMEKRRQSA